MQQPALHRLFAVAVVALALGLPVTAWSGTTYQVTQLATLGGASATGTAINHSGQIVGYSTTGTGAMHAARWDVAASAPIDVDPGIDASGSQALGINSSGAIVGTTLSGHGFVSTATGITDLGANTSAAGINDNGDVAGSSGALSALFSNGTVTFLGMLPTAQPGASSLAYALNDSDQVVGTAYFFNPCIAACPQHAFLWSLGAMSDLGFPGEPPGPGGQDYAAAFAINAAGDAVGRVGSSGALWSGGSLTLFGTAALAINSSGAIVGSGANGATLWQSGVSVDLNQQIDESSPFYGKVMLQTAVAINDDGLIVATETVGSVGPISYNTYVLAPQVVIFDPTAVGFGNQPVGTPSAARAVAVSNTGPAPLAVTGIGASAGFSQTNDCGSSLAAGAGCSVQVTFTPVAGGAQSGTLNATVGANPYVIALSGSGTLAVSLSASASEVPSGSQVTLSWVGPVGSTCALTGGIPGDGWSGTQPASGSVRVMEAVAQLVTYSISCAVGADAAQASAQVVYTAAPAGAGGGGGGALDPAVVFALLLGAVARLVAARHASRGSIGRSCPVTLIALCDGRAIDPHQL